MKKDTPTDISHKTCNLKTGRHANRNVNKLVWMKIYDIFILNICFYFKGPVEVPSLTVLKYYSKVLV